MPQNSQLFLNSVQNLRGLAALMVVLYHMEFWENYVLDGINSSAPRLLSGLFSNGFAGVDLFFVISGFVMVIVTERGGTGAKSSLKFLYSRASRIYPLWWIYLLVYIAGIYIISPNSAIFSPPNVVGTANESDASFFYVLQSFFLIPQGNLPIYGLGWTLVHEMLFYAIFAIFLVFPRKYLLGFIGIWSIFILVFSAGKDAAIAKSYQTLALHYMNFEFIFGALSGLALLHFKGRYGRVALTLGLAALMASLCLYVDFDATITLAYGRVLPFGLPAAAIVYGAGAVDLNGQKDFCMRLVLSYAIASATSIGIIQFAPHPSAALICGLALWGGIYAVSDKYTPKVMGIMAAWLDSFFFRLGNASYTLYLAHWIVLFVVSTGWFALIDYITSLTLPIAGGVMIWVDADHPAMLVALIGIALCASVIFALLAYRFVEQPIVTLTRRTRKRLFE